MKNIPKICHLYWDNSPMSYLQVLTISSFHKYNPDWKIIVYLPPKKYEGNSKYIPDYIGEDYFYLVKLKDYVEIKTINLEDYNIRSNLHDILRSDIFRYKILYEFGGVWTDFDVIWLKPINHIYNIEYTGNLKIDEITGAVCMFNTTYGHHNISILIHSPGCEFLKSIIAETDKVQKEQKQFYDHQDFGTVMFNRMYPTYDIISKSFNKIIALKYETFFPYSIFNLENLYEKNDLRCINNNVLCVHWFNGHNLSKQYVNEKRYNSNCSMSSILKSENWI